MMFHTQRIVCHHASLVSRGTAAVARRRQYHTSRLAAVGDILRLGTDDPRMSRIVQHNGVVYTSGQTDTSVEDVTGQTKAVLAKIDSLLDQAGTSKQRLLTAQIWLKDMERDFASMNAVWSAWLDPQHKPVRATVQAPMARPAILVEIQVTAAAVSQEGSS